LGKHVVLSETEGPFREWANQFVNASPADRDIILVNPRGVHSQPNESQLIGYINSFYGDAARRAGSGGQVIISLGHGGAHQADSTVGMVDLLPNRALRLQSNQLAYHGSDQETGDLAVLSRTHGRNCRGILGRYDLDPRTSREEPPGSELQPYMDCLGARSAQPRQRFERAFTRIGQLLRDNNVSAVVLLTCNVGHAPGFINRLASYWRMHIIAYQGRVGANRDEDRGNPYYIYIVGDERNRYRDQLPDRHVFESSY
jgi:hypothetical protein